MCCVERVTGHHYHTEEEEGVCSNSTASPGMGIPTWSSIHHQRLHVRSGLSRALASSTEHLCHTLHSGSSRTIVSATAWSYLVRSPGAGCRLVESLVFLGCYCALIGRTRLVYSVHFGHPVVIVRAHALVIVTSTTNVARTRCTNRDIEITHAVGHTTYFYTHRYRLKTAAECSSCKFSPRSRCSLAPASSIFHIVRRPQRMVTDGVQLHFFFVLNIIIVAVITSLAFIREDIFQDVVHGEAITAIRTWVVRVRVEDNDNAVLLQVLQGVKQFLQRSLSLCKDAA